MKLKGINAFEQHVEKIVLGVAVLGVVGIAAWQYLSAPAFKVGKDSVAPSEIDGRLQARAEALQKRLGGDGNINIPTEGVPLAAGSFTERMGKGVSPVQSYGRSAPGFNGLLVKSGGGAAADVWYHEPSLAPLAMLQVEESVDALTADGAKAAAKASDLVKQRFGEITGPKDIVWTTPVARIDLAAIRAEYARAEAEANPARRAIPAIWYEQPIVVDVVFERRVKKPDGSWSTPTTVPVFASRQEDTVYRGRIEGARDDLRADLFATVTNASKQREILQPPFYDTVNNSWVSPLVSVGGDTSKAVDQVAARKRMRLQSQLQDKQHRAEVLRTDLAKLGGPWDEEQEKRDAADRKREEQQTQQGSSSGGGGKKSGGGGGLGGAMNKGDKPTTDPQADEKRKRIERKAKTLQLKKLEGEIADLEKQLGPAAPAPAAPTKPAGLDTLGQELVWAYDLEVEPGKTYQYRCVARVYNPFFGKGNQLVKEQASRASVFTIDTVASGWSDELTISPSMRFFVTRALVGDGVLQAGSAQVEVYRLVEGQWRRLDQGLQPGDRVGRVDTRAGQKEIDFGTSYYLVDVIEDLDAKTAGAKDRRPGIAVIRAMGEGSDVELRVPADELADRDLEKLRLQADDGTKAKPKSDAADADPKAPKGPAGPGGPGGPGGGGKGTKGGKPGG